jgi:hypothetical protein
MARITTSAGLNVGTELVVNLGYPATTIQLVATGNLVAKDGVTMQALYTKLLKLWTDSAYNAYPFPLSCRDQRSGQFSWGTDGNYFNGSGPYDTNTRNYIRDAGWNEYDSAGVLQKVYVGVKSFGTLAYSATQPYYTLTAGAASTNLTYTGVPNEAIKVYDLGATFDQRTYLELFAREYGYTFDSKNLASVNETASGAFELTMSLTTAIDTNLTDDDATVAASAPYTGITATWLVGNGFGNATVGSLVVNDVRKDTAGRWFICTGSGTLDAAGVADYTTNGGSATLTTYSGERDVNGTYYAYNIIVEGNGAAANEAYTKLQYLLRQTSDIDSGAGSKIGNVTGVLANYVGSQLVTTTGVYLDNFASVDSTKVTHTDVLGVGHSLPLITNQSVTITGATAGTRIQIYDLTSSTELYNGTPTFPYTWTDPAIYAADRDIRLRASYVSGATAKQYVEAAIGTSTEIGYALTYLLTQEDDTVYNTNAVDGSTVTFLTIDDGANIDEIDAPSGTVTLQDMYAAAVYYRFGSTGIAGDTFPWVAADTANYALYGKTIKNTSSPTVPLKITGGWITDGDTGNPIDLLDTSGGTVFLAPPHVVSYAVGSGVTPTDVTDIASAVWDETLAAHSTADSAGKLLTDTETTATIIQAKVNHS